MLVGYDSLGITVIIPTRSREKLLVLGKFGNGTALVQKQEAANLSSFCTCAVFNSAPLGSFLVRGGRFVPPGSTRQ